MVTFAETAAYDARTLLRIIASAELPDGTKLDTDSALADVWDNVIHALRVQTNALYGADGTDNVALQVASTNRGGSITLGGTAQAVMAANAAVFGVTRGRRMWRFQNTSDTEMRLGIGITPTSTTGYLIAAGCGMESNALAVETDAINVYCATTGKTFAATEL